MVAAEFRGSQGPQRVLICDDERHIVRLIEVNLERQGYIVTCAFGGAEAISILEVGEEHHEPPFERLFIDGLMPEVDGYAVLSWVRRSRHKHMWVALSLPEELVEEWMAREYWADRYISKPFNPVDLFR